MKDFFFYHGVVTEENVDDGRCAPGIERARGKESGAAMGLDNLHEASNQVLDVLHLAQRRRAVGGTEGIGDALGANVLFKHAYIDRIKILNHNEEKKKI